MTDTKQEESLYLVRIVTEQYALGTSSTQAAERVLQAVRNGEVDSYDFEYEGTEKIDGNHTPLSGWSDALPWGSDDDEHSVGVLIEIMKEQKEARNEQTS